MEEEWGKLIIEMLDREKLLRPAVERSVLSPRRGRPLLLPPATGTPQTPSLTSPCHCRLELLLQIANKIQNGALSCEEKLTLAKNTLQAVSGGWFYPFVCFPALLSCPSPPLFFPFFSALEPVPEVLEGMHRRDLGMVLSGNAASGAGQLQSC